MDRQLGRFPLHWSVISPLSVLIAGFIIWAFSPHLILGRFGAAVGFICLAMLGISLTRLMWIRLTDNWEQDMHGIARDALIVRANMKRDHRPAHAASGDLDEEWRRYFNG
jgi:hypothetical protein